MNIWQQLLIGFSPFVIIAVTVTIKRRYFRTVSLATIAVSLAATAAFSYFAFFSDDPNRLQADVDLDLYLLGRYIIEEEYDAAEALLNGLYAASSYDEQYTLYMARLEFLRGRTERAAALYRSAETAFAEQGNDSFPYAEASFFLENDTALSVGHDDAAYRYLLEKGEDPADYGISPASLPLSPIGEDSDETDTSTENEIEKQARLIISGIKNELAEMREGKRATEDFNAQVNLLLDTDALYRQYVNGQPYDERELKKIVRRFEEWTESGAALGEELKLARMKALAMEGEFRKIPQTVKGDPSLNELLVLSELYVKGLAKPSDFENFVSDEDRLKYDKVLAQAEKVLIDHYEQESRRARTAAKERVDALRKEQRHLALANIKSQVAGQIDDIPLAERSKAFMQLSKMENFFGNTAGSDAALDQAMDSAVYSDDSRYAEPMQHIMRVIQDKETSEAIKNIPQYVAEAASHAAPIALPSEPAQHAERDASSASAEFEHYFTNFVSKKRAMLNIGIVDTSNFPEIRARIQISDLEGDDLAALKNKLEVYDQGIRIEDFRLEKLTHATTRIMLLTDISGSMSNAVDDLKNAVGQFIGNIDRDEYISVVGFDSTIQFAYDFTQDASVLQEAVDRLGAFGGTAIYQSLMYGMEQFPADADGNHVIILMTDGMDNSRVSADTIAHAVGSKSVENNITVYTLGLGPQVDANYLETIAAHGNGKFIYAVDAVSLREFYRFIHDQLAGQYVLTFRAKNTVDTERELTVMVPEENVKSVKRYRLLSESGSDERIVGDESGVRLHGLDPKMIIRSGASSHEVTLHGEGFSKLGHVSVALSGDLDHLVANPRIEGDNRIVFSIPGNLPKGTYDLVVTAEGYTHRLPGEFTMADAGKEKTITFGPYTLTADEIIEHGHHRYTLKGRVRLNDFLQFRGDLLLEGDYKNDLKITLTDYYGSTVAYDRNHSRGLAKAMAALGIGLDFSSFGKFVLYNDERNKYNYGAYRVESVGSGDKRIKLHGLALEDGSLYIYPDSIKIRYGKLNLNLPFQRDILKYYNANPFTLYMSGEGVITPNQIGVVGKFDSYTKAGWTDFSLVKLPAKLVRLNAAIDTINNDYALHAGIQLSALPKVSELGLRFALKGGKFDEIKLFADFDVPVSTAPVPVTLSDFGLGLEGMSKVPQGSGFKDTLLGSYITGKMDIAAYKLSALLPFLKKFLPDASLITVDDATAKTRLRDFSLLFQANVKLFGQITLDRIDVRIGHFSYDNYLLNIPSQEVTGLYIASKKGIQWDSDKISFDFTGTHSFTVNSAFTGIWGEGVIDYDVDWFIFHSEKSYNGNLLMGVHAPPNNKMQFSIIIKGTDLRNNKQKGVRIVFKDGSIVPKTEFY